MTSPQLGLIILLLSAMPARGGGVFWTDRGGGELKRMNFDGSNLRTIVLSGDITSAGTNIRGVAVDMVGNRIFWADNGTDQLLGANLDGSGGVILVKVEGGSSFPADIRIDPLQQFLFWCDQTRNQIERSSFDGANVTDIITNAAPTGPYFMDLDPGTGKIYWGDFDGGSIYRANLDGSNRETLVTGINMTRGVRIDPAGGMLYWINRDDKKVQRCPLSALANGSIVIADRAVQTLYSDLDTPHGLVLDIAARKIYWADTGTNSGTGNGDKAVSRGDFDGSTPMEVLAAGVEPWDVDLDLRCATYDEWRMRFFRKDAPPEQIRPESDPDDDGIPNVLEYAFGLSPLRGDGMALSQGLLLPGPALGAVYPALRFMRRISSTDLTYLIQSSHDLQSWTGDPANPQTTEVSASSFGDGMVEVTARSLQPLIGDAHYFLRPVVVLSR